MKEVLSLPGRHQTHICPTKWVTDNVSQKVGRLQNWHAFKKWQKTAVGKRPGHQVAPEMNSGEDFHLETADT